MQTRILTAGAIAIASAALFAQGKPQNVKGLQVSVKSVERAEKASLRDCPPATNSVNAVQRPGDELAVVTVDFKVTPDFKPAPMGSMKRPTATATDGKVYNTSIQFVDVGSVPEYSCQFVYRVPTGTKLKTLQIEGASFDLSALESK
ncbi:MAG TPA: hypothetical protein VEU08_15665 [Vicinamibacterales bacterium]|nr:hypothetical protein [Vicinamibacterales bacterium]